MARPIKGQSPPPFSIPDGMEAGKLELARIEKEDERNLRLHKDKITFWVKDIAIYLLGIGMVVSLTVYSIWILVQKNTSKEDRQFATTTLTSLVSAVIGTIFGKSMK